MPLKGLKIFLMQYQTPLKVMNWILGVLIDNYEKIHFPIDLPDPIEAINSEWNN